MQIIEINVMGMQGTIFQSHNTEDRYSLHLGGYYNWHCPLKEAIERTEKRIKEICESQIAKEFKSIRRKSKLITQL